MSEVTTKPVIVGIDGSDQAQYAAVWAVDEALRRHAVLRLIYVVRTDLTGTLSASEYEADVDSAKAALAAACTAIAKRNPSVVVETAIVEGSPAGVLLAESPDAGLICIGSSGIGRISRAILGSTAASVAEEAACAVVVVRGAESTVAHDDPLHWIVLPVTRHTEDNRTVITEAIAEARYRRWPMLAVGTHTPHGDNATSDELDQLVADWQRQFPDVHVYPISCDTDMAQFLRNSPDINGLVVLDAARSTELAQIIGGVTHAHRADLAVLVARENADVRVTPAPARHR